MPREPRIQYPGAIYHVLNRGDQRDDIFLDNEDRQKFTRAALSTRGTQKQIPISNSQKRKLENGLFGNSVD